MSAAPSPSELLKPQDRERLQDAGIDEARAAEQVRLLREGMRRPKLLRPATRGDGIEALDPAEFEALGAAFRRACADGRWVHFIPASGAATRLADALVKTLEALPHLDAATLRAEAARDGKNAAPLRAALKLWEEWERLPFADALHRRAPESRAWRARGEAGKLFDALLRGEGEGLLELPKGLVPFHRHEDGRAVTAVEEHIREALALAPEAVARLHFTVSPEHEARFRAEVDAVLERLRAEGGRAEVAFSFQDPSTQTLALDEAGAPFRDASGSLVLRPGGHGSLLSNLEDAARAAGADFAWVRNIDNIPVEERRAEGRALRRALGGLLMRRAEASAGDRPVRVCGMVENTGEPGGGPFWIETDAGPAVRIVESAEVDVSDADQLAIFKAATHFNPVDLACALRDGAGRAFDLRAFSHPSACFIADKTHEGRALKALEWPGLWNGAMAKWETHCVEIPVTQFAPVKTVLDLLRAEHQG